MLVSENGTGGVMGDGDLNGDELGGFLKQLDESTSLLLTRPGVRDSRLHQKRGCPSITGRLPIAARWRDAVYRAGAGQLEKMHP